MAVIKPTKNIKPVDKEPIDPISGLPSIKKASSYAINIIPIPKAIVEGVLSAGSVMVYGGASKTNKTFALLDLAISVSTGKPWWEMKTTKGRVLYMDFELQPAFFRDRLAHIAQKKDLDLAALDNLDVWHLRGQAKDLSELMPHILKNVTSEKYDLIIIDPIYKVLGERDENSAGDINSLMNELDALSAKSGAAIVVGHHFSKGGQAGKESMDRISGSGVFGRSPDSIVVITRHETKDVFTVEMTLRNFKPIAPFCVQWDCPQMVRTNNYDPAKLKNNGQKQEVFPKEKVLEVLRNDELTKKEWKERAISELKLSERTFDEKQKKLVEAKLVTESGGKWKRAGTKESSASVPVGEIKPADAAAAK